MDTRQLLDSLTAHLSLYHRRSPALRNPNPNPRKAILRWFSDLPLHQRRSALTIVDRAFVRVLLQMQARARARGHGSFLLLPDIPSSDPSVPALCFRKSTGLLERSGVSDSPERSILGGLLLFRSREGMKGEDCALDSVIVTEGLVGDVDRFVEVMDGVSDGGFLRGEVDGLGSAWCELEWLKDKGYYSVGSFVANRLEVALRMSWLNSKGGKKQKGAKLKDKDNGSAVAANVFWRKKGCLDWFLGLDPGIRKKIVMTFLRKGAKSLAKEILNSYGPYGSAKDEMCNLKDVLAPHRSCSGNRSYQRQHQLHCDLEFSVSLATESSTTRGSLFHSCLVELLVLQQITSMLVAYDNNEIGAECLIFSTLDSVQTVFDLILVRFRGFLTVVARDSIEHELVATVNTSHPITRKTKEKLAVDVRCKNKCRNPKRANSNLKPSKVDLSLKESCVHLRSGSEKGKHTVEVVGEIKLTNSSSMKDTPGSNKHSSTINMGHRVLDNHQSSVSRKKSKRRGATCKSIIKEVAKAEKPTMLVADSASLLSVENEGSELNLENTSMLNVLSNDNRIQDNLQLQSSTVELQDKSLTRSGRETSNANIVDVLPYSMCGSYACHMDHKKSGQFENENPGNDVEIPSSGPTWSNISFCNSVNSDAATSNLKESLEDLNSIVQKVELISCADKASPSSIKELGSDNLRSGDDPSTQPISTDNLCNEAVDGSRFSSDYCICSSQSPTIPIGGKSYEWPNLNSVHFSHFNSGHLPAATDRYHLDVTYNWPNNFHQSYYSGRHQIRTSCIDHGGGQMVPSVTPPASIDWPPMVRSSTLGHSGAFSYDFVYNTRLQSSLCTGISDLGIQFRGTSGDNEWKYSGDGAGLHDYKKTFDFVEDTESNWLSEEEYDMHTTNARDYNKFFGGGIMYWNPSDPVGTSFSRAPSHSSEESSWAWYESDLSRAIDDMIDVPGFPSSYTANGLASPTSGTFCSPFDGIGPGSQSHSHGYVISTTEVNKKALDSQCPVAEVVEEKVPGSKNTSSGNIEGAKIDSLPYPILRPIVIPSSSRKSSRSEFRYSQDHVSPCPPSRRDAPRIKRPPSPVVLCVPRAPRVPPPSPVGESRKHRGFPVVRSGSSSPRNWGTRNCHQGESKSEGTQYCMDGPEVVWASWGSKGISNNSAMQSIPGSLLQDRLIAISQLARDQDHPDVAFPLQPPETVNCPSRKLSFSVMHSFLQEEINSFCKQVANENQLKKPYINWSVKRVAKSLQVLWPRSRTSIFGSNATGLALPTSDVDLVVCLPPVRNLEPIKEAGILEGRNGIKETCLQHAARYLANQEWVKNDSLKTIENTTIPLIMLVAEVPLDIIASNGTHSGTKNLEVMPASMGESGKDSLCGSSILENVSVSSCSSSSCTAVARAISVDISFKSPSHTGLQTTALVRELTEQFPAAVPLALVLKQFLADRSLDRAYSGGLSSYCLVLLITRFLQHEHHIGRPLNQNLGSLLMDFLYFFGNVFDPRQMRVSIQGSGLYMNRERGHSIDPIHIDDPLCPTNNVGRNCFRIHQCIKIFWNDNALVFMLKELQSFFAENGTLHQTLCAYTSQQNEVAKRKLRHVLDIARALLPYERLIFWNDNALEFMLKELRSFFAENGTLHQTLCAYTSQQNEVAKRKLRHVLDIARALLVFRKVPKQLWGDAVLTAIYLINRAFADAYSVLESELSLFSADFDPCAQASIKLLPKIIPSTGLHGQGSLEIKNKD